MVLTVALIARSSPEQATPTRCSTSHSRAIPNFVRTWVPPGEAAADAAAAALQVSTACCGGGCAGGGGGGGGGCGGRCGAGSPLPMGSESAASACDRCRAAALCSSP